MDGVWVLCLAGVGVDQEFVFGFGSNKSVPACQRESSSGKAPKTHHDGSLPCSELLLTEKCSERVRKLPLLLESTKCLRDNGLNWRLNTRFGPQTPRRWGWGTPLKKRAATRTCYRVKKNGFFVNSGVVISQAAEVFLALRRHESFEMNRFRHPNVTPQYPPLLFRGFARAASCMVFQLAE